MKRMISKVDLRRLKLIDVLTSSENTIPFDELSKVMSSSERIILDDIRELNKEYDEALQISIINGNVHIKKKLNFGFEDILHDVLSSSQSFQILESLFFNPYKSIEKMALDSYTSTSTMYRKVMHINNSLYEGFNIKLRTTPLSIEGNESDIRKFYYQLFTSKYKFFEWPFHAYINEKELESFMYSFIKELPLDIDFAFFRNMKFIIAINIIRIKKGFKSKLSSNNDIDPFILEVLDKNHTHSKFSKLINLELNLETIKDIFYGFVDELISYSSNELIESATRNITISQSYFQMLNIIKQLTTKFDLTIPNQEIVITNLHNTVTLGQIEVTSNFVSEDRIKSFLQSAKDISPHFLNEAKYLFTEYLEDVFGIKDDVLLNTMLFNIYTHWHGLYSQLIANKNKVNIVVLSSTDHLHARFMGEVIMYDIPNHAEITVIENTFIDEVDLYSYDIIVANFPIGKDLKNTQIYVNNLPTSHDLQNITEEVNRIFKLKNAN